MSRSKGKKSYKRFFSLQSPKGVILFLLLFGSLMGIVIVTAYSRRSGNTGLDMARVYQLYHKET